MYFVGKVRQEYSMVAREWQCMAVLQKKEVKTHFQKDKGDCYCYCHYHC